MRKLISFILVIVVLAVGWIFYLNQEKKNFIENLSQSSAIIDQPINNSSASVSSINEMEASNDFVKGGVDGERFSPDARVPEPLPQEQNAAAEKTSSETPTPDEKADFVHDQWIQMFGDIPEVHAASEYTRKMYKQERMTIDERIAGLEASHYLFPEGGHGLMLEMFKTMKAQGIPIIYEEDLEGVRYTENHKVIHLGNVPEHLRSDTPAPDSMASGGIGEDTVSPPVMPESQVSGTPEHIHQEEGHVHETPTIPPPVPPAAKSVESGWEGLSFEQREQAKQLFDEYGTTEGLRRLREMDPEAARQFERERRKPSVHSEPNDEPPTR